MAFPDFPEVVNIVQVGYFINIGEIWVNSLVQWGSEIQKIWMVKERLGCKWSWFWMGSEILTNGCHFVKKHLKCVQKVGFSNGWDQILVWTIAIVKARPYKNWTIWNPDLQKVQIWNISVFGMVGFQIPTVFRSWILYFITSAEVYQPYYQFFLLEEFFIWK